MAYSHDLRVRVIEAYEAGEGSRSQLSSLFNVGTATLGRWVRRYREDRKTERRPRGGGNRRRVGVVGEVILGSLVARDPDATLEELADAYTRVTHRPISSRVICHALHRMKLTRKKRQSFPRSERVSVSRS